jgi:hypothetical protein
MAETKHTQVVDERDVKVTSVLSAKHDHALVDENATLDEKVLVALGYRQEFKRSLSTASTDLDVGNL